MLILLLKSITEFENIPIRGAVAQLGERGVRNAEVGGSIPLCSTILFILV
jgi:hypothetical protein